MSSFTLSLIMISLFSLFECITCYSSSFLAEIKLIAIVNWIFQVSGLLRLFMMSFKYGLILFGYSPIESVLFLSPLLSYWRLNYLLKKSYLLLMVYHNLLYAKKVPNISKYSFFNCFLFFFQTKRFLISLTAMSSFSFFSLKIFLTFLIKVASIYYYYCYCYYYCCYYY